MNLLIDTLAFIWFLEGDKALSNKGRIEIENNDSFVSIASLWEIAIKINLGKLKIAYPFENIQEKIVENNFNILPISFADTLLISNLELHHRDPFDRILIAQTLTNKMSIVSRDNSFDLYGVKRIW